MSNKLYTEEKVRQIARQFKEWLNNGDGGYTPYEPYITNRDILCMSIGTIIVSGIIILGCYLSNFYCL